MTAGSLLPHLNGALNGLIAALLIAGFVAIRRGDRRLHPRLMVSAVCVGALFLVLYVAQVALIGHQRFPGDDLVRDVFLVVLTTHTALALVVIPLVLRAVYLGTRRRFPEHRRLVRVTYPVWLYVSLTGVVIYWMNNHLRPPA
jgi:putative membrane protein